MSKEEVCPICLEANNEKWKINGCTHLFCFECIQLWANNTNKCPMCKNDFTVIERRGARTLSSLVATSKKRVTRSQVDKRATVEVAPKVLEHEVNADELRLLGLSEEEIELNLAEPELDENEYDFDDGWLVRNSEDDEDEEFEDKHAPDDDDGSIEIIRKSVVAAIDDEVEIIRPAKKRKN